MSNHILHFQDLTRHDTHRAGGKGASLGEMTQADIPVPPGFVVLTEAFEAFLDSANIRAKLVSQIRELDHHNSELLHIVAQEAQRLITRAELTPELVPQVREAHSRLTTKHVAVRSSATSEDGPTTSWAGELESFLNVEEKDLLKRIQDCWASLFSPRALFYRHHHNLHKSHVSVAVVVQEMIASEISGIAFTVHPVTRKKDHMLIEAGYGLGEAIVSGAVTPDSYVVRKRDYAIIDRAVAEQRRAIIHLGDGSGWVVVPKEMRGLAKLSDAQLVELAGILSRIEEHYGFPCDIEWAYHDGRFFIVQSRPITTL